MGAATRREPGAPRPTFNRGSSYRNEVAARAAQAGPIADPRVAGWVLEPIALLEPQEVAVVASLNVHGFLQDVTEIARGAIEHVDVSLELGIRAVTGSDPRNPASRWALLAHNHPSGTAAPSRDDAQLWHDARERFRCAGIALFDHLVLARGEFYTFQWRGLWRLRG